MEIRARTLLNYVTSDGKDPFQIWLRRLGDPRARARVRTRLDRVERGNFGDSRSVGDGVFELRLTFGPGYRVYFGVDGDNVILLYGGTKDTQPADIKLAKAYWKDYRA